MFLTKSPVQPKTGRPAERPNGARSLWRYLAGMCPPPLALALLIFVLAWALALWRGPLTVDIGADNQLDMLYLTPISDGFFAPESRSYNPDFPQADTTYRWAGRTSRIKLPWPLDGVPLKVYIRVTAPRKDVPANQTSATVKAQGKLEWTEQDLGTVQVDGTFQGNYYEFKIPEHLRPNLASYEITFTADNAFQPGNGDVRGLSLLFFSVRIEPDYAAFGWKGWIASLARPFLLAAIAFCCWGLGRCVFPRRRAWLALSFEASAGLLLLLSILYWPQAAEPLYASWAFILPITWILLALAELFRQRAPNLPAPFVYAATIFPLLPLFQFGVGRLDLYSLNPASIIIGIYVGALFFMGAIYISIGRQNSSVFERYFVRVMLVASVISFGFNHFNVFQQNLYRGADFKVYYQAMERFAAGNSLYNLQEIATMPGQAARMPPGFTFLLWPLVQLFGNDVNSALLVWRIFSELLLVPCLLILLRVFGGERQGLKYASAVWFFALNFGQISESLGYGQWNVFVLLGLSLMALWIKENKLYRAGAILALPVSLKLYPVVSTLYFFFEDNLKRAWKGLAGLVAGGAIVALLVGMTVGFDQLWFYATQVVFGVNRPEIDISNQSLWGFWSRLAVPRVMADYKGEFPGWVTWLSYACVVLLTALNCLVLARRRGGDDDTRQLKLGSLALLGVIIPPFVWMHYIVPCLVAVLALLVCLSRGQRATPKWMLILFALAYAALAYGGRNDFFYTDAVGLARFSSSYRFLANLALWAMSLWLLWHPLPAEAPVVSAIQPAEANKPLAQTQ
ncbi:MAG TPA: glycosyltransferase family 87 protein [Chloroflexia bacterium]|nr:glycosyltransferase family 87 protein [Chloroflexia bacterium]